MTSTTNDLRLELRARNNILWHVIFDSFKTVAEFCRQHHLCQSTIGGLLNLSKSPFSSDGVPSKSAIELCRIANLDFEGLFPYSLYSTFAEKHMFVAELSSDQFISLTEARRIPILPQNEIDKQQIAIVLKTLTPQERDVITKRFGLDGEGERKFEEISVDYNLSMTRIQQIEAKALRKMRHPSRARHLRDL